jgi:Nucleotide modification associated domain 3
MHGPIFRDGTFEYIPIPDCFQGRGVDSRTYGSSPGKNAQRLIDYFPLNDQKRMSNQRIHFDPEFVTFTYGDPTPPKASLRRLTEGSLLVFYGGFEGWDFRCPPALYIIGYFNVSRAGSAGSFSRTEILHLFGKNFHVMHQDVFSDQRERLVLVKGGEGSRLLNKAVRISSLGRDKKGNPIQRLSNEMQRIFGDFEGHTSIQRSPPRWVKPPFIERAAEYVLSLR